MSKKIKIIIISLIIVTLLFFSIVLSFNKFSTFNSFSAFTGVLKILFTDTAYTTIQNVPYKVMVAQPNQDEKTANDLLNEYMYKRGFYQEDRLGSMIIYSDGTNSERVLFSVNAYYSVWEWI